MARGIDGEKAAEIAQAEAAFILAHPNVRRDANSGLRLRNTPEGIEPEKIRPLRDVVGEQNRLSIVLGMGAALAAVGYLAGRVAGGNPLISIRIGRKEL